VTIPLTQDELKARIDYNPETGVFTWRQTQTGPARPDMSAGAINGHGYRSITVDGKAYYAAHLAWYYMYNEWPDKLDHANRVRDDNRIANLRKTTRAQNRHNAKVNINNELGCRGVSRMWTTGKWRARMQVDGKPISLGHFTTKEEAIAARRAGELKYYGSYAAGEADAS